ncbi:FecCD family ABC transporter permease [Paenibacillus crassostreae]|uniref:Ferrichrome ABC transporter permease n=1 Tax=Paenibacillus crassostreae TaxID=1763538 RepID=A0A167G2R8_9BACL|nr:iron ABC transporter permease [Paenibacillus crassostreae]AOZ93818.1 ferrichrome ABC transporter permease [Paenibacillus crassostreae]OAB77149.1 ferrichrome ABC transporter permease [Paenibacillus crassostreae]
MLKKLKSEKESETERLISQPIYRRPRMAIFVLIIGMLVLIVGLMLSISVGAVNIPLRTVWDAIFHYNSNITEHGIIQEIRVPRALADILVGAGFAVAGAIMQGMTRNPMADSGILGINAGAIFMVAISFAFFPGLSYNWMMLLSFIGAAISLILVYGIGALSRKGMTPIRLVLAGSAISALFTALSEGVAIYTNLSQDIAFWFAGGTAGAKWNQLEIITPWILLGLICALLLSRSITILSLGDEIAKGLGQRMTIVRVLGALIVLILAGVSVSIAGPISFVGLVIPHIARLLVGVDYRWIIPCSAILGGILLTVADIGARMINAPFESPIGALIAILGVPFFLYVARKEGRNLS